MIIDQLPLLSTDVQGTDEIPIERGTSTYKTTQAELVKSVAEDVDRKGLPVGGSAGQILAKVDGTNYNTEWINPPDPSGFVSYAQAQTLTAAQQAQARENIGASGEWTLLWTNASPTSSFAAQTISLNLSAYKFVCIAYGTSNASDARLTHLIHEKGRTSLCISLLSNKIVYRPQNGFTDSGIVFGSGVNVSSYGSGVDANDRMVPMKIYGIKG